MATIEALHPEGRLSVRFDNNRRIEFNPNEHRHLDHGYAVTSHSSQGLTAERVLVQADTSVHPDLLNSRFGYLSISRASHEATLFTDDVAKLGPNWEPMCQRRRPWKSIKTHRSLRELG
jgi:ATP-dependent exoDNAse (exonuclease V) alpha subunit